MFSIAWGGAAARGALLLVLLSIGVVSGGCRRTARTAQTRAFVRLDTLLPLHPTWAQVTSLQRVTQRARSARTQIAGLRLALSPLPPAFPAPKALPGNLAQERRQRIAEDARRRIAGLTQELRRRNEERIRREERAARRQLEARLAAAKAALEAALPARLEAIRREAAQKIEPLRYREVVFLSETREFTNQPLLDAQTQLNAVRAEIARLNSERDTRLAEARADVERQLDANQAQWTTELEQNLARRRAELEALAARQIAHEEASLEAASEPIPNLGTALPPPPGLAEQPQPPAVPPADAAFAQARTQVGAAVTQQQAALEAQKQRLLASIRKDTEQAVIQVAQQRGWTLVSEGTAGASDMTATAAEALRAQWQQGGKTF